MNGLRSPEAFIKAGKTTMEMVWRIIRRKTVRAPLKSEAAPVMRPATLPAMAPKKGWPAR